MKLWVEFDSSSHIVNCASRTCGKIATNNPTHQVPTTGTVELPPQRGLPRANVQDQPTLYQESEKRPGRETPGNGPRMGKWEGWGKFDDQAD